MKKKDTIKIQTYIKTHTLTLNLRNVIEFPDGLLEQVKTACPDISQNTESEVFALITALSWIGPPDSGPVPEKIWKFLINLLMSSIKPGKQVHRVIDFVVAFGCGKWRNVKKGISTSWDHIWPGARKICADIAESAIRKKANPWLKNRVKGFPEMGKADIRQYVHFFIERFLFPEFHIPFLDYESLIIECSDQGATLKKNQEIMNNIIPGTKYVFSTNLREAEMDFPGGKRNIFFDQPLVVTPGNIKTFIFLNENNKKKPVILNENKWSKLQGPFTLLRWECSCGHIHCRTRHRLSGWKPEIKLKDCIYSALKGAVKEIKTNSFINGMYFPDLAIDVLPTGGRLRFTPVEYKKCSTCNKEYEGERCTNDECRKMFNPFQDKRFSKDVIIMLGLYPEYYILKEWYKCPVCSNIYDINDTLQKNITCSFCHTPYFDQGQLEMLWKNEQVYLQQVRKLHKALLEKDICPTCLRPRGELCWCPLGRDTSHINHTSGCLPQRPVFMYSQVFYKIVAGMASHHF